MLIFMVLSSWQSHCKSLPGLFDERQAKPSQAAADPQTKPDELGCESACKLCKLPFIISGFGI